MRNVTTNEILDQMNRRFNEIFDALHEFSTQVDRRFENLESDVTVLKSDMTGLKSDMTSVKSQMVTKSYLDDKLADLRGDLVGLARKGNKKFCTLVNVLHKKEILSATETSGMLAMEPFPQSGK